MIAHQFIKKATSLLSLNFFIMVLTSIRFKSRDTWIADGAANLGISNTVGVGASILDNTLFFSDNKLV